jgi:hypothetical protein
VETEILLRLRWYLAGQDLGLDLCLADSGTRNEVGWSDHLLCLHLVAWKHRALLRRMLREQCLYFGGGLAVGPQEEHTAIAVVTLAEVLACEVARLCMSCWELELAG